MRRDVSAVGLPALWRGLGIAAKAARSGAVRRRRVGTSLRR